MRSAAAGCSKSPKSSPRLTQISYLAGPLKRTAKTRAPALSARRQWMRRSAVGDRKYPYNSTASWCLVKLPSSEIRLPFEPYRLRGFLFPPRPPVSSRITVVGNREAVSWFTTLLIHNQSADMRYSLTTLRPFIPLVQTCGLQSLSSAETGFHCAELGQCLRIGDERLCLSEVDSP